MSQAGLLDVENSYPQIPTLFVTDSGSAIAILNEIDIIGGEGIDTFGSGKTITVVGETATAGATALLANLGVASFNSADFNVVNGFVSIASTFGGIQEILTDSGLPAVVPNLTGTVEIRGGIGTQTSGNSPSNAVTVNTNIVSLGGTIAITNAIGSINLETGATTATQYDTDSGTAIPALGILNVIGGNSIVTSGGTNIVTIKNMADNTKYVVDPRAGETNFTTIQSAIDAAYADYLVSGLPVTIYIRPATYTENLTLYSNINLVGDADQPTINGWHVPPSSGEILFENIYFTKNGYILTDGATAGTTDITFNNCKFKLTYIDADNTIVYLPNWTGSIKFIDCNDISVKPTEIARLSTSANLTIENSELGYGNVDSPFGFTTTIKNSSINCSCLFHEASVTFIENSYFDKEIKTEDTATVFVVGSYLNTGVTCPITHNSTGLFTISDTTINTSNATAITGTGTVQIGSVTYIDSSALDPALTLDYTTLFETGSLRLSNTTTGALSAASGVVSAGTLTVANGGTGAATLLDHGVLVGSGTVAITALTVGNTGELLVGATGADPAFGTSADGNFTFTTATAGTDRTLSVTNTENTNAASHAHTQITTGGASGGDPYTNYLVSGAGTYSIGIDNSDSDKFKITSGSSPSAGTDLFTMTSAGVITLANDLDVSEGGTGVSTLTSHGILMGNGAGDINATAEPTDGQLLIGKTGNFPTLATLTAGSNVTITNGAGTITIASSGGLTYAEETGASKTIVINYEYGANRGGGVAFTLPATAAAGTRFAITGISGLWSLAQAANQYVKFGDVSSTVGAGGSLTATDAGDCITCTCIVADLAWRVVCSVGDITIT